MIKVFEFILEVWGWIRIVLSPLLTGIIIGLIVYGSNQTVTNLCIGIGFSLTGLIVGIIWGTKVWKKQGTINFLSRISGTPELDSKTPDKDLKK